MSESASVKVAARLRPLTPNELRDGCELAAYAFPETQSVTLGRGPSERSFGYVATQSMDLMLTYKHANPHHNGCLQV